jgi:hypothetical protein
MIVDRPDFRLMTDDERAMCLALSACRFSVASFAKRFARNMGLQASDPTPLITAKQAAVLRRQVFHYRKQIRAKGVAIPWPEAELRAEVKRGSPSAQGREPNGGG